MIRLFEDNDRLYARLLSGQEVSYVTHRALAWYNIAFNGEILFPLGCGTLSQVPISSVNISSQRSAPASLQEGAQTLDSAVCGKEPQGCEHPLAAACYWMLYRRDLPTGWITVSQQMLEYRQRILCHLKDLDERNLLLDKLVSIVGPASPQNGALGRDDEKDRALPTRQPDQSHWTFPKRQKSRMPTRLTLVRMRKLWPMSKRISEPSIWKIQMMQNVHDLPNSRLTMRLVFVYI
jgi:hypothetical protein